MTLEEQLLRRRKIIVRRYPSAEALAQIEKGHKFIVVKDDFDLNNVPQGYALIDMKHKGVSFKTLVPQSLLFYMANPGEGNPEGALEEIADFYGEAEDFEGDLIKNGETNVQEANWATVARESYEIYLINRLIIHKRDGICDLIEPEPEFDPEVLHKLDLDDYYVLERAKAIAALALGKTAEQVNTHEIGGVLKHVILNYCEREKVTNHYRKKCWSGSHYEYKDKYRTRTEFVHKSEEYVSLTGKIGEIENDIAEYREKKHGNLGRHDQALIRQYINLAHIAKENPKAQLDIKPPEKIKEEEK